MGLRWTRRILWLIVLAVLVVAPARLATDAPAPADGALMATSTDTVAAAAPFTGVSPTLVIGGIVLLLTLAAAVVRGHRTTWRM